MFFLPNTDGIQIEYRITDIMSESMLIQDDLRHFWLRLVDSFNDNTNVYDCYSLRCFPVGIQWRRMKFEIFPDPKDLTRVARWRDEDWAVIATASDRPRGTSTTLRRKHRRCYSCLLRMSNWILLNCSRYCCSYYWYGELVTLSWSKRFKRGFKTM